MFILPFEKLNYMQDHLPGFLIAIEGIDGAGKTTQAHFVQERLAARKLAVIRTKEPTTGQWGQVLRDSALTGRLSLEEEIETFIKAKGGMTQGWTGSFDKLENYLADSGRD